MPGTGEGENLEFDSTGSVFYILAFTSGRFSDFPWFHLTCETFSETQVKHRFVSELGDS